MIEVVSAVIVRDGRLLLTQRPASKAFPLLWETPGGKVEGNESHHQALAREMREELGVRLASIAQTALWCDYVEVPSGSVFVLLYFAQLLAGEVPRPREGQGLGWFDTRLIGALPLAPANAKALGRTVELLERDPG